MFRSLFCNTSGILLSFVLGRAGGSTQKHAQTRESLVTSLSCHGDPRNLEERTLSKGQHARPTGLSIESRV